MAISGTLDISLLEEVLGRGMTKEGGITTYIDMLIYGRSGAGKTYRAATAPGPIYMVSPDPTGHKVVPFEVSGKVVRSLDDLRDVMRYLGVYGWKYNTVIIDGLSWIHDLYVKEMGEYYHREEGAKDPDLMPIQGRMKIQNKYRAFLRAAVDLTQVNPPENRVNVILTTLEERVKEDEAAPFGIRPLFGTQKMQEQFPAFFSAIGYIAPVGGLTEDKQPDQTRRMLFVEHNGILARDRLSIFPLIGEAPNLAEYLPSKTIKGRSR